MTTRQEMLDRIRYLEAEVAKLRSQAETPPPIVPEGIHRVRVADVEERPTARGHRCARLRLEIIDDPYDRSVWANLAEEAILDVRVKHTSYAGKRTPTVMAITYRYHE